VSGKFFCGKSCLAIWKNKNILIGEHHGSWKNGANSYRNKLLRSNVSPRCASCGFDDIRALVAHHINRDRTNNHIKNLKWLCHNCHYLEHEGKTI
jgi:hypothetical protein